MESFSQPGLEKFEGKIEELDFYRNENNTGPIVRIYAVKVLDANEELMKSYGNSMPHSKYGTTRVYFLSDALKGQPELRSTSPFLSGEFQAEVLATYTKSSMGSTSLVKRYVE
ncbi:hypothetical protein [Algoriphagus sediminis]|uniref:Uncharacterized protein n=1 Tax=Algoriphagus sediminis TaxID=3057113 RepID=A0ABT7YGD8_9BACT|nr:hypothetical protein [Algoriphagus sediminis]MDN3205541.1 hypothetical protein [Algoriphagus sediminis]